MSDSKTTNRRQFFQQFARRCSQAFLYSVAASSVSPVFSATAYGQSQRKPDAALAKLRVIIVGAGIAGISAAVFLCKNGVLPENITILEGRDRIGGRIHSVDFAKNTVDLGASWIHGHHDNPIAALIGYGKQQKSQKSSVQQAIQVARTNYEDHTIYDDTGKQLSDDAVDTLDARFDDLAVRLADLRESFSQSTKSPSTSQNTGVHALDLSLAEAINKVTTPRERSASLQYSINTIIEHEYAADSSRLSFLSYDDDESVRGDDLLFLNGYRRIFDILLQKNPDLSRQISSQIILQQTVTRIALARDGQIRVETVPTPAQTNTQTNTQTNVWTADVVISTLPVGVLQRAQQNNTLEQLFPDWSDEKNRALAGLSMGVLNKLFLRFPTPFWDTAQLLGYIDAQKKGFFAETLNLHTYTQEPMLLFFNAGTYGEETEKLTDQQLTDAAMQVLRKIYRKKAQDPTHILRSRWGSDPFSYGSYAHIDVGGSKKSRIALAKPIFLPNSTSPSQKSARIFLQVRPLTSMPPLPYTVLIYQAYAQRGKFCGVGEDG